MQVQPIQSQNNYQKTNFKAYFVNDANGYFRHVFGASEVNDPLRSIVREFTEKRPNHQLEIISARRIDTKPTYCYDIFNHTTGKTQEIYTEKDINNKDTLYYILYKIIFDRDIFKEDGHSELFKSLTGLISKK